MCGIFHMKEDNDSKSLDSYRNVSKSHFFLYCTMLDLTVSEESTPIWPFKKISKQIICIWCLTLILLFSLGTVEALN